ncbi:helix-turn-helix domain-containing protein [Nocardioides zeae]|jgi:transcriptional regulator with XRE-family HTH domain|uniref:Helix-turn-helix transcriptional regulator n=2 Tax=Nocardioides zeae TaxID=1457234 RepID=A0A6P0HNF5_9ACTN|nr:helix-turn-helix transcriptional regulator [Nocardioides zeae]MDQ1105025.1 transcriptional regulator with XRE-family HTH domain [Nocardioides zeae]MDR6175261.1 transcriptional regulator with XRE-family HTH domain [Nocardioides zeae]MDR6211247.1 transcriptional regulator with XRE-family HTH domain [Nocardioides zeae]NEN80136.1 helix-turn-helix transcriptional regulator [Nocardioides zeae]
MEDEWKTFSREVGVRLQQARQRKGLSQERVAHLAGVAGFTYQKFEKGESRPGVAMNPRLQTLLAVCEVLEIDVATLLEGAPRLT